MTVTFCDRCKVEFEPGESECDVEQTGLEEGQYGASIFKVILVDQGERKTYPSTYVADLCPSCQRKLNEWMQTFMKIDES